MEILESIIIAVFACSQLYMSWALCEYYQLFFWIAKGVDVAGLGNLHEHNTSSMSQSALCGRKLNAVDIYSNLGMLNFAYM